MEAPKRRADEVLERQVVVKKQKVDAEAGSAIVQAGQSQLAHSSRGPARTSSLDSPIMLLTGHSDAVKTLKFNPDGTVIASGSEDKLIFLWNVQGECENFGVLKGHQNTVLELHWTTDGANIVSASPDKSVRCWDAQTGKQVKRMAEHSSYVNSCCPSRRGVPLVVSGSDDGTAKLWDLRVKGCLQTFPEKYQITSVAFSDAGDGIFTGGIENDVKMWDLRKGEVVHTMQGHTDTITGMSLSPDGDFLMSNAMDNTVRIWDVRPFVTGDSRCTKVIAGHQHGFEKELLKGGWSPDGARITCGSADRFVHIWEVESGKVLYKLPGHAGSVNECAFHPKEPIVASGSSDKQIYLGEIDAA